MASAGGGASKSSSSYKPTLLPEQKKIWEYFNTDIIPMAEGKDTALSKQLMQQAQDTSASARAASSQNIMDMAGATGMGSSQVASLLKSSDMNAMRNQMEMMNNAKLQTANAALNMVSGLPIGPGQSGKSSSSSWNASASVGSTERIKKDVRSAILSKRGLLDTRPVTFEYKFGYGTQGEQHTGYIAEELDKLGLKNVVKYDSYDRPVAVDYNAITVHLVELVKELNTRINKLEGGGE